MSKFAKFDKPVVEQSSNEIDVSFLCMTCDEPVVKATVLDTDPRRIEWTCSNGHTSSMKWNL